MEVQQTQSAKRSALLLDDLPGPCKACQSGIEMRNIMYKAKDADTVMKVGGVKLGGNIQEPRLESRGKGRRS